MSNGKKPADPNEGGNPNSLNVSVVYGLAKPTTINRKQSMNAVLQAVLKLFDVTAAANSFRLLLQATGAELPLDRSAEDAGLVEGSVIVLAPRAASGGR